MTMVELPYFVYRMFVRWLDPKKPARFDQPGNV